MSSTFMGLEIARRGMFTQQSALYVTGQNVANASTPGYSRQRVNFTQTEPYPGPGLNRPMIPGQMGTGVTAGSIQRMRDSFLDTQYRGENNKLGYWQSRSESLSQMENIMNEPSDSGLSKTMDLFWQSLQDLAVDPTNTGARSVVRQRGQAVAETFNYLSNSLTSIQKDQKSQLDVTVKQANSVLNQLNNVNQQIGRVEPHGLVPNDLYDERDRLVDQLSQLVNIQVSYVPSGGNASEVAEGIAEIKLVDDNKNPMGDLLTQTGYNDLTVNYGGANGSVSSITLNGTDISPMQSTGKIKALIESYGYDDGSGTAQGTYTNMLNELDALAFTFSTEFNKVQKAGFSPNEINAAQSIPPKPIPPDYNFFADTGSTDILTTNKAGFASRIQLTNEIKASLDNIATAGGTDVTKATLGDATNVSALANIINEKFEYKTGEQADFRNYFQNVIGAMAVISQEATRLTQNSTSLQQAVDEKRQSVSSVSLDEEMTNMIQFQQAYNASARMITLQDELLDKIINGMGTGGR